MLHLHRGERRLSRCHELSIGRLLLSIGFGVLETVWVIYMESFGLSNSEIGFINSALVLITIAAAFESTKVLERNNHITVLLTSIFISALAFAVIGLFASLIVFLSMAVILTAASVFRLASFNILFRNNTSEKNLNEEEGFLYALMNIGWLVGPLLAGLIVVNYGMSMAFYAVSAFMLLGLIVTLGIHLKNPVKKRNSYDDDIMSNIKDFFANKKMRLAYAMTMSMEAWWALVYIYMPLFMIQNNLSASDVGVFLSFVVIPLIVLERKFGALSRTYGFRKIFLVAYGGLGVLSIILFFVADIQLQLVLIILGSILAAMAEPNQDTHFFKLTTSKQEEKFFPIYGTAGSAGSFVAKMVIACVLLILPNGYAYLTMAVLMGLAVYGAQQIRPTLH